MFEFLEPYQEDRVMEYIRDNDNKPILYLILAYVRSRPTGSYMDVLARFNGFFGPEQTIEQITSSLGARRNKIVALFQKPEPDRTLSRIASYHEAKRYNLTQDDWIDLTEPMSLMDDQEKALVEKLDATDEALYYALSTLSQVQLVPILDRMIGMAPELTEEMDFTSAITSLWKTKFKYSDNQREVNIPEHVSIHLQVPRDQVKDIERIEKVFIALVSQIMADVQIEYPNIIIPPSKVNAEAELYRFVSLMKEIRLDNLFDIFTSNYPQFNLKRPEALIPIIELSGKIGYNPRKRKFMPRGEKTVKYPYGHVKDTAILDRSWINYQDINGVDEPQSEMPSEGIKDPNNEQIAPSKVVESISQAAPKIKEPNDIKSALQAALAISAKLTDVDSIVEATTDYDHGSFEKDDDNSEDVVKGQEDRELSIEAEQLESEPEESVAEGIVSAEEENNPVKEDSAEEETCADSNTDNKEEFIVDVEEENNPDIEVVAETKEESDAEAKAEIKEYAEAKEDAEPNAEQESESPEEEAVAEPIAKEEPNIADLLEDFGVHSQPGEIAVSSTEEESTMPVATEEISEERVEEPIEVAVTEELPVTEEEADTISEEHPQTISEEEEVSEPIAEEKNTTEEKASAQFSEEEPKVIVAEEQLEATEEEPQVQPTDQPQAETSEQTENQEVVIAETDQTKEEVKDAVPAFVNEASKAVRAPITITNEESVSKHSTTATSGKSQKNSKDIVVVTEPQAVMSPYRQSLVIEEKKAEEEKKEKSKRGRKPQPEPQNDLPLKENIIILLRNSKAPMTFPNIIKSLRKAGINPVEDDVADLIYKSEKQEFLFFNRNFIGLMEKKYNFNLYRLDPHNSQTFEYMGRAFFEFCDRNGRMPFMENEEERFLDRWVSHLLDEKVKCTPEQMKWFRKEVIRRRGKVLNKEEWTFVDNCHKYRMFFDEHKSHPNPGTDAALCKWFARTSQSYNTLNQIKRSEFDSLVEYLDQFGLFGMFD